MKKLLVIVDMQNDFIRGSLKCERGEEIVENICALLNKEEGYEIALTQDTHNEDYLNTQEGQYLPIIHCMRDSWGWQIDETILSLLNNKEYRIIEKNTFGTLDLIAVAKAYDEIHIVGLCTDICVINNVLLLKAGCPETKICIYEPCCDGSTYEKHLAAIEVMKSSQVEVIYEI